MEEASLVVLDLRLDVMALRVFANLCFYELVEDAHQKRCGRVFLHLCASASEAGEDLGQTRAESRSDGF